MSVKVIILFRDLFWINQRLELRLFRLSGLYCLKEPGSLRVTKESTKMTVITHSVAVVKKHSATETAVLYSQVEWVTAVQVCLKHQTSIKLQGFTYISHSWSSRPRRRRWVSETFTILHLITHNGYYYSWWKFSWKKYSGTVTMCKKGSKCKEGFSFTKNNYTNDKWEMFSSTVYTNTGV